MEKSYDLLQVHTNPRDGSRWTTHFESYETLKAAKAAARKELKGARWVITESKVVAQSSPDALGRPSWLPKDVPSEAT